MKLVGSLLADAENVGRHPILGGGVEVHLVDFLQGLLGRPERAVGVGGDSVLLLAQVVGEAAVHLGASLGTGVLVDIVDEGGADVGSVDLLISEAVLDDRRIGVDGGPLFRNRDLGGLLADFQLDVHPADVAGIDHHSGVDVALEARQGHCNGVGAVVESSQLIFADFGGHGGARDATGLAGGRDFGVDDGGPAGIGDGPAESGQLDLGFQQGRVERQARDQSRNQGQDQKSLVGK